jgi:hypothetical protein
MADQPTAVIRPRRDEQPTRIVVSDVGIRGPAGVGGDAGALIDPATQKLRTDIVPMSPATAEAMEAMDERVQMAEEYMAGAPGGVQRALRTATADTEAVPGERLRVDASAGPVTVTLPLAQGRTLLDIKKVDLSANAVTLVPQPGEVVERGVNLVLNAVGASTMLVGNEFGGWDAFGGIPVPPDPEADPGDLTLWYRNALI